MDSIIISRCSTLNQNVEYQANHLKHKYNKYNIVKIFESYGSGLKNFNNVEDYINYIEKNKIKFVLVTELSRISRKDRYLRYFINNCKLLDVKIICSFDDDNSGGDDYLKKIIKVTEENKLLKNRLNAGRDMYIKNGGKLGRKKSSKMTDKQLLKKHGDVVIYLKHNKSIRDVMMLTNKSSGTVQKIKKIITYGNT